MSKKIFWYITAVWAVVFLSLSVLLPVSAMARQNEKTEKMLLEAVHEVSKDTVPLGTSFYVIENSDMDDVPQEIKEWVSCHIPSEEKASVGKVRIGSKRYVTVCEVVGNDFRILLSPSATVTSAVGDIVTPTVLVFFFALLLSLIFAYVLGTKISKQLDFVTSGGDVRNCEPELRHVLERFSEQKIKMQSQLEELERKKNEFSAVIGNMSEGLIVLNERVEILSCNAGARSLLGFPNGPLPLSLSSVLTLSDGQRRVIRDALVGTGGEVSYRIGEFVCRLFASPVSVDGTPAGAVLLILNETEKEERESLRREFSSNVSHELKTPLTSISGYAELIETGKAGEDALRFGSYIHRESNRLLTLVNDIIRLSELDEGNAKPDRDPVDLAVLVSEVADRFRGLAEKKTISLSLELPEEDVLVFPANRRILDEAISNLADNAIKYGKEGGRCRLSVFLSKGRPTVSVSDDGAGIPAEYRDRIFERFYRIDKSHSKEIGGTGLGLSIVKHAALYHKASISLESEVGVGSTFTLTFPISK